MKTKKIAYLGLLIALAFVFSYIEFLIPVNIGVPGAKLGLANLVVIVALYTLGERDAFLLSVVRIVLVGFTFANMASMIYSLAGGILSYLAMLIAKRTKLLSMTGVSVLGGVFHNVGQIIVAILVLETASLVYYLPVLLIAGITSGVIIGILGAMVTKRMAGIVEK
ncbi:MAG: Gx transporter family protein [Clostridiales bacterium]|nr:Gx transporter family protein [Roseburia sp.]MDD7638326.1 Gx transporter family protein [Clostridiales bacterium]MDY4111322.1 Gx transporter family protein [Roseburia sp.]